MKPTLGGCLDISIPRGTYTQGMPMKKRTRLVTNSTGIMEAFSDGLCRGDHTHEQIMGHAVRKRGTPHKARRVFILHKPRTR